MLNRIMPALSVTVIAMLCVTLSFFAFLALPAQAQVGMPSTSYSRDSGIDRLTQRPYDRTGFDSTRDALQRKADEEREKQEFQERQRRRSETAITNRPEQLLDSYFNRRSFDPYNRR